MGARVGKKKEPGGSLKNRLALCADFVINLCFGHASGYHRVPVVVTGFFLGFLQKLRFQQQAAQVGFAIDVVAVGAIDEADAFDFGALFQRG